jgi:glycine cleavage system H protein
VEDIDRGIYRVGITDYAQYVLDDIISITLPETGIFIEKDEEIISIDSIEDTLVINSPISGKIIAINDILRQSPELLNESPYDEGWIVEMEIGSDDDLDQLMDSNEILDVFHEEIEGEDFDDDDLEEEDDFDEETGYEYSDNISDY